MKIDLDELERLQFHDVGAGPQTVRALIARIRELEAVLVEERNDLRDGCYGQQKIDAILEKGAVLP